MNEQESKFSRRDFFKGAVASGVAATTVGLMAACSPQAKGKGNDTPPFIYGRHCLGRRNRRACRWLWRSRRFRSY